MWQQGTHLTVVNNLNQIPPTPASANPYAPGEPIVTVGDPNATGLPVNTVCPGSDLSGGFVNGAAVSGQVALNLAVACGTVPVLMPFAPDSPETATSRRYATKQTPSITRCKYRLPLRRRPHVKPRLCL